jgi:hypothetical protein
MEVVQSTSKLIETVINRGMKTTITFVPPCRLEYAITLGDSGEKKLGLVTYCIPVSPGKSRIVAQFTRNFAKTLHHIIPRWWTHVNTRNLVLDGDMIILHQQEKFLQDKQASASWKSIYKLATGADRLVIEFRNWFDQYCGGQLPWEEVGIRITPTPINDHRAVLLDRYSQHTRHCHSCRNALKVIQRLQVGLLVYSITTIAGVALLPDALRIKLGLPLVITAALSMLGYSWLKFQLVPQFYFVDYIHPQKQ